MLAKYVLAPDWLPSEWAIIYVGVKVVMWILLVGALIWVTREWF